MPRDAETDGLDPTELKYVGPATAEVIETASFGPAAVARKEVSFGMLLDAGVNPGVAARIRREHSLPWSFDTEEDRGDLDRRSDQIRGLGDGERAWVAASAGDWTEADDTEPTTTEEPTGTETAGLDTTGSWPATARPDDTEESDETGEPDPGVVDPRPAGEWPTTARPDDEDDGDDETDDGLGEWPATARPDGVVPGDDDATGEDGPRTDAHPAADDGDTPATADGSGDPVQAETAWRERSAPVPVSALDGVDETVQDRLAAAGITSVRSLATADPAAVAAALDLSEETVADLRASARSFAGSQP